MSKHMFNAYIRRFDAHGHYIWLDTTENPNKYIFLWFLFTSIEFPWYFNEF